MRINIPRFSCTPEQCLKRRRIGAPLATRKEEPVITKNLGLISSLIVLTPYLSPQIIFYFQSHTLFLTEKCVLRESGNIEYSVM